MTISEMLSQSGILTLLGMVVVFSFILIMIASMGLLHALVRAFKLDKTDAKTTSKTGRPVPSAGAAVAPAVDQGAIIAAIAVAIREKESV